MTTTRTSFPKGGGRMDLASVLLIQIRSLVLISDSSGLVFESPVWSGFLVPQGLNRNRNRSTFVPEVKKTGPDRKKTENRG
jgi:hypothetical protein